MGHQLGRKKRLTVRAGTCSRDRDCCLVRPNIVITQFVGPSVSRAVSCATYTGHQPAGRGAVQPVQRLHNAGHSAGGAGAACGADRLVGGCSVSKGGKGREAMAVARGRWQGRPRPAGGGSGSMAGAATPSWRCASCILSRQCERRSLRSEGGSLCTCALLSRVQGVSISATRFGLQTHIAPTRSHTTASKPPAPPSTAA
jgi:hypothetical protein